MKIPNAKLENVCANPRKDKRSNLHLPYYNAEHKALIATNGRAMVIHFVEPDETDTSGYIPLEALKAARSKLGRSEIKLNGCAEVAGASFQRPDLGTYPDYKRVVPTKPDRAPDVSLDAALLLKLAQALIDNKGKPQVVNLWIPQGDDYGSPIYVEAHKSSAVGVLMPCRKP